MTPKFFIAFLLILFSLNSCNSYMVVVDDSKSSDNYFRISPEKLHVARALIDTFEINLKRKGEDKSVLKNVSMDEVYNDLRYMLDFPNSTVLGNTGHYCSISVVLNWLLNNQPEKYTRAVLELCYYGKTKMTIKGRKLKLPKALMKKVDYSVIDTVDRKLVRKDLDETSISDFVLGVSLMYSIKQFQRVGLLQKDATYRKSSWGNFIFGNTAPWEMNNLLRNAGLKVEKQGFYLGDKENIQQLLKIQEYVNKGNLVILFDNHWITYAHKKNAIYEFVGAHYSTLHSINVDTVNNIVDYSYWDYGLVKDNPYHSREMKAKIANSIKRTIKLNKKFKKKKIPQKKNITTKEFLKALKGYWVIKRN